MGKATFDEKQKRKIIKVIMEQNLTVAQVARDKNININTLYSWKKKYGLEFIHESLPQMTEHQRIKFFQQSIRDLKEENSILKKRLNYYLKRMGYL